MLFFGYDAQKGHIDEVIYVCKSLIVNMIKKRAVGVVLGRMIHCDFNCFDVKLMTSV